MRRVLGGLVLLFLVAAEASADISAFGPGFNRHSGFMDVPFEIVLDVNGEAYHVDVPHARARLRAIIGDDRDLVEVRLSDRLRTIRWVSSSVVDFREEVDGALVHVRLFPLRKALGARPRIYAKSKADLGGEWIMDTVEDHVAFNTFNVPMTAETITPLSRVEWEIGGIDGPRRVFDPPYPLLSGTLAGRQFEIGIRELGFGEWDDVVVKSVPEPASVTLILLGTLAAGARAWQKRHRLGVQGLGCRD